jgi:hypothetical protein
MSMFRSDTGFRGPYSLVTRNTCGGGEDRECRACLPPSLAIPLARTLGSHNPLPLSSRAARSPPQPSSGSARAAGTASTTAGKCARARSTPTLIVQARALTLVVSRPAPSPLPSSPTRSPFADPDHQAIGHAFSPDGFDWRQSPGAAATSVIAYEDGAAPGGVLNVTFGKRERPHLLFDPESGAPVAFISAVAINPACDPFVFASVGAGQARLPSIDAARLARISADPLCGAWVQYQRLDLNPSPGYYDRSWTHVQRLRTAAPAPAPAR